MGLKQPPVSVSIHIYEVKEKNLLNSASWTNDVVILLLVHMYSFNILLCNACMDAEFDIPNIDS